jgi:hypothetical protein
VGTVILVALVDPLSSRTQKAGDKFKIRVAAPVSIGGTEVLSVGDEGVGEVIDAAPPGMGGRGGKLVLAARYVDHRGIRVPLRAFKLGGSGSGRAIESLAVTEAVSFIGLAVEGDQIDYPAGTQAIAKVAALVDLSPITPAAPAAAPSVPPAPPAPVAAAAPVSAAPPVVSSANK